MMTCQEVEELSGTYVLDAITPQERSTIEEHVAGCPKCMRMVQELQAVVDLLPLTVTPMKPPVALRERILDSIQEEAMRSAPARERRRRLFGSYGLQLAAAVLFLVLLGTMIVWNISLQEQITHLSQAQSAPITYTLKSTSTSFNITGHLYYFPDKDLTVLTIHGLPSTQGGQIYQGWLLRCNRPFSIGTLSMNNGVVSGSFQGGIQGYDTAAVSLEPGPGASKDAPKGQVVVVGQLNMSATATCGAK